MLLLAKPKLIAVAVAVVSSLACMLPKNAVVAAAVCWPSFTLARLRAASQHQFAASQPRLAVLLAWDFSLV